MVFFFYKYQINSIITLDDMKQFSENRIKFKKRISPIFHLQLISPKLELERLKKQFKNFNNSNLKSDYFIFNANNNFYNVNKLNLFDYFLEYRGKSYILFKQRNKYRYKNS